MSHDSTPGTLTDNFWPELTADTTMTQSVPRSVTLDTIRSTSDGKLLEVSSQLDLIRTRLNSLEHFVLEAPLNSSIDASVHDRIAEMELSVVSATTRFDELANRLVESDETVATTVISTVDGFDTRIALMEDARLGQASELNELTGYLEQAFARITELAEIIETNNDLHVSRIADLEGQLEDTQTRASLAALESTVADIAKRSDQASTNLNERVDELHFAATAPLVEVEARVNVLEDKLVEHGEQIHGVEDQVRDHSSALDEQRKLSQEQSERLEKHEEELGIQYEDIARLKAFEEARVTQFETHSSIISDHGETLETHSSIISDHGETLDTHSSIISDHGETLDTHTTEIAKIQSDLEAVQSGQQQAETSQLVSGVEQLARNNGERISAMAETTDVLGQRIDHTETANNETAERVATQEEALGAVQSRLEQLESTADSTVPAVADTSEIEAELEATSARVAEVESTTNKLTSTLKTENKSLRQEMTDLSVRVADFNIAAAAAPIMSASTSDDRVDEIADSAKEAHQLAESLRVIQAEIVHAMKGELNAHDTRLVELEDSQSETTERLGSFASADRLEQIETKLVEALQTISQLTQLQRRHTAVETQLADALSASNQGIEHTQQHVVLLRSELENANARIARLEQAISVAAQPAVAATPAATAAPAATAPAAPATPSVPATPAAPATPEAPAADPQAQAASVDTGWFESSYEERRAS